QSAYPDQYWPDLQHNLEFQAAQSVRPVLQKPAQTVSPRGTNLRMKLSSTVSFELTPWLIRWRRVMWDSIVTRWFQRTFAKKCYGVQGMVTRRTIYRHTAGKA